MPRRHVVFALIGLAGAVCLGAITAVVVLPHIDLHWIGGKLGSYALGREVVLRRLRVSLGDPVVIEADDATLANVAAGSVPEMGRLAHLSAALDPWQLLRGTVLFRRVAIDGVTIVLERTAEGVGNWRFVATGKPRLPADVRALVPTCLDLALTNATLTMRTSSGNLLRVEAKSIALRTTNEDTPISVVAEGSYDDTPIRLDLRTQSFARLRDGATPFGVVATATGTATTLTFDGTMTNPLHADGIVGIVRGEMERLDTLLTVAGVPLRVNLPLKLASPVERRGDMSKLSSLTGTLAGATFVGNAEVAEGGRGQPDRVGAALDISQVNADILLNATSSAAGYPLVAGAVPLTIEAAPGLLLDARLGTQQLLWHGIGTSGSRLRLSVLPGKVAVSDIALSFAGGTITGSAEAVADRGGVVVTSRAEAARLDLQSLLRVVGVDVRTITGQITGHANLALSGATLGAAVATAHGQVVLTLARGQVKRRLMQLASSDPAALFDPLAGMTPILCLLAVSDINGGIATVAPLRLRTRDGTIVGGGDVNLRAGTLALTFQTLPATTGFFALDLPIDVVGSLSNPSVRPGMADVANALAARGSAGLRRLSADIAPIATGSDCAR